MKRIRKTICWAAIVFLILWIIRPLVWYILGLEFASDSTNSSYKKLMFYAVPIAMLLTLFGTIKAGDKGTQIAAKVLATVGVSFMVIFLMIISILTDMCVWTNGKVLYESKLEPNTKIIEREYGCGAFDSEPPTIGIYKVQNFTKYFIRSTEINVSSIDKNEWIPVNGGLQKKKGH